jgi:hypothetical protein
MLQSTFDPIALARAAMSGALAGGFTFVRNGMSSVPVRLLEASSATVVLLIGPYDEPTVGGRAVTVIEARIRGDALVGGYVTRPESRRQDVAMGVAERGTFEAMAA